MNRVVRRNSSVRARQPGCRFLGSIAGPSRPTRAFSPRLGRASLKSVSHTEDIDPKLTPKPPSASGPQVNRGALPQDRHTYVHPLALTHSHLAALQELQIRCRALSTVSHARSGLSSAPTLRSLAHRARTAVSTSRSAHRRLPAPANASRHRSTRRIWTGRAMRYPTLNAAPTGSARAGSARRTRRPLLPSRPPQSRWCSPVAAAP